MAATQATRYENEMRTLRQSLIRMGGQVEEMLGCVIEAMANHDADLAKRVVSMDQQVDQLEKEIDEQCLRLLALHQPAAMDLRFVTMSMKLVTDLERMGDLVGNVAERVIELAKTARLQPYVELPRMAELTRAMINQALDAFVERNTTLAEKVMADDNVVDELHWQIRHDLMTRMTEDSKTVHRGVNLVLITKHLERLGDHATNIAEEVIFLVKGRDVRHQ